MLLPPPAKAILVSLARLTLAALLVLLLGLPSRPAWAQEHRYRVHGLEAFDRGEQERLVRWLHHAVEATRNTLGPYPFDVDLYLYRRPANEPVPHAHTWRGGGQSVHFYVDPGHPLPRFIEDWTAYHEIAHLALPYLGERQAWFAEGFASYLQYQIMADAGLLQETPLARYRRLLRPHLHHYQTRAGAAQTAQRLMARHNYPAAYWGGAWFFVLADEALQSRYGSRLTALLGEYLACCRRHDRSLSQVIASLDRLLNDTLFRDLLTQFERRPARELINRRELRRAGADN